MIDFVEKIKKFQEFVQTLGYGGGLLSLPSPKTLLLTHESGELHLPEFLFDKFVTEKEIVDVCRDLFESGFYNLAVSEAFKALDIYKGKSWRGYYFWYSIGAARFF